MLLAHTAAVAKLGIGEGGNTVNNLEAVCGAFLGADAAAVAKICIDGGLFPLLFGSVFAAYAVFVEKSLIFAYILACAAVDAAVGVNLMLFFHITAGSGHGTDLRAFVAAVALICNFISHSNPPC